MRPRALWEMSSVETNLVTLPITSIVPLKEVSPLLRMTTKYSAPGLIRISIPEEAALDDELAAVGTKNLLKRGERASCSFFVANPINRYAIGDRDQLVRGADGSVTIYVQNAFPGERKESNWLPAPAEDFNLIMRLYWPTKAILDGLWKPPSVELRGTRAEMIA